jgi:hypothetical protein
MIHAIINKLKEAESLLDNRIVNQNAESSLQKNLKSVLYLNILLKNPSSASHEDQDFKIVSTKKTSFNFLRRTSIHEFKLFMDALWM